MKFNRMRWVWLGSLVVYMACSSMQRESQNLFRFNIASGITSLDPAFAKDQAHMWVVSQLYQTLVTLDSQLQIQTLLARRWEVLDSGLRYRFWLRTDVPFHRDTVVFPEGTRRMTAHDVVYSFQRLIDPKTVAPGSWIFTGRVVEDSPFVALNDSVVEIRLQRPFAPFLYLLTMPYASVVAPEAVQHYGPDFHQHAVGTGPFQVESWREEALVLKRNPDYWRRDEKGQQLPYLDGVLVSFMPDPQVEFFSFLDGKLDFVNALTPVAVDRVFNEQGQVRPEIAARYQVVRAAFLNTEYFGFMLDSTQLPSEYRVLLDRRVRKAMDLAFDRKAVLQHLRRGIGIPGEGGMVHPAMGEQFRPIDHFNVLKAQQLLAEAGYPGGKGFPKLTLYTNPTYRDFTMAFQKQMEDHLGIHLEIEVVPPAALREMMAKGKAYFFRGSWIADYPDPETFLVVFYSRMPAPPNYTRFRHRVYDSLYEAALRTIDVRQRLTLYRLMDSIVQAEMPVLPLYYDEAVRLVQPYVRGLHFNSMGMFSLERVRFQKR